MWTEVGTVSLDGTTESVSVGTVPLPSSGGVEIRIQQLTPPDDAPFRAGLVYIKTASGRTYGTRKFWGHPEGEDYLVGSGMSSEDEYGVLTVEPRYLNLKALKAGRTWQLRFWCRPAPAVTAGGPTVRFGVADDTANRPWTLALPNALARLVFR
jgi:hypothetical protein